MPRRAGLSYPKIAKKMGIKAVSYVHKLVSEGIAQIVHEPAEALVALENERFDEALSGIYETAVHGELAALDRLIKISESRRKMLGLDAPTKQELKTEDVTRTAEQMREELGQVFQRLFDAKQGHGSN
jgi:hypothetical protein